MAEIQKNPNPFVIGDKVFVSNPLSFEGTCTGVISDFDEVSVDGLPTFRAYRIDVESGDHFNDHRNETGELWVNDFEMRPI